jgi:choline transporter-like protein 2/4/5
LLWVMQFLFYFCFMVIAGATADWYFTPFNASGGKDYGLGAGELNPFPVCASCFRTCRFHLGTIALASLIIAIIQFLRACVEYVQMKMQGGKNGPNKLQQAVLCMLSCCLKCVECCMDKINRNALIWCSIWGDNFIVSACSSFALLWRNLFRVAAINIVTDVLIFIGKLSIASITMGIAGYILTKMPQYADRVTSPVFPCLFVFIEAYVIASVFMLIFDTSIDTVFLCFLVDCEQNNPKGNTPQKMLASDSLTSIVSNHSKESAEKAERIEQAREYSRLHD